MIVAATLPEDLLEVCDSLCVLRDGKLVWSGDASAAMALAAPQFANTVRVRAELLDGLEAGLTLLGQRRDLEVEEDGRNVWFLFTGDQETLANLLPQLIRAGCSVAHFGIKTSLARLRTCETFS